MNVQEELLRTRVDPHVTRVNLEALAGRALGSAVRVRQVEVLSGGCWNRVLGVVLEEAEHPGLVVKISPHCRDVKVINEYHVHERFASVDAMRTPKPYLLDVSEATIPGTVFVMERLPGRVMHACHGLLSGAGREHIIRAIAADVAALHTVRERGFGSCADAPAARCRRWPEFWLPRFDAAIREVRDSGLVEASFLNRIAAVRPAFEEVLDIGETGVLTHYDIWSGNVMIDLDAALHPRVSGYVDTSGFFADYARELSFAEMFGLVDGVFREVYEQRHRIDPEFRLRGSIYNLKMSLKHVTMYPSETYYRRLARDCLGVIEQATSA